MAGAQWSNTFRALLARIGAEVSVDGRHFSARNFLLDARPHRTRVELYEGFVTGAGDYDAWRDAHDDYLNERVRRGSAGGMATAKVPRDRAADTFTVEPLLSTYGETSPELDLVRVVPVASVAILAQADPDEVLAARADPLSLGAFLEDASDALDARPTFAGFWEDVVSQFGEDEEDWDQGWANDLRDQFGLLWCPPPGGSIPVFLFRYSVGDLPKVEGLRGKRPLAVPTVLDADLFAAFCPAPPGVTTGQLVDLAARGGRPAAELLHPPLRFNADHLRLVGQVTEQPGPLAEARATHLLWLQDQTGTNYGDSTDADLLS